MNSEVSPIEQFIDLFKKENNHLQMDQIEAMAMGIKSNGEKFVKVRTTNGLVCIRTLHPNGITFSTNINIEPFFTTEERNNQIRYLYHDKNINQNDIALFLSISQATVSNVLSKGC